MSLWHTRSKRRPTGAKIKRNTKKNRAMRGSPFLETTIEENDLKIRRVTGGNKKRVLLAADTANVLDPKTKKYTKSKILSVEKNEANLHYARRNILTKGALIKTELGEAVITSRPAQHGIVNAKLVSK